jgi:hypothetical protein
MRVVVDGLLIAAVRKSLMTHSPLARYAQKHESAMFAHFYQRLRNTSITIPVHALIRTRLNVSAHTLWFRSALARSACVHSSRFACATSHTSGAQACWQRKALRMTSQRRANRGTDL